MVNSYDPHASTDDIEPRQYNDDDDLDDDEELIDPTMRENPDDSMDDLGLDPLHYGDEDTEQLDDELDSTRQM